VIVASPTFSPNTWGCVAGVTAPVAIKTLFEERSTIAGSLLVTVTTSPPGGAGVPRVTASAADCPRGTDNPAAREMADGATTPTFKMESKINGEAPTCTFVKPTATPVMGTTAVIVFAVIVAVAGTVTSNGSSDFNVRITSVRTGDGNANVTFTVLSRWTAWLSGPDSLPTTCTTSVSPVSPKAEAVIDADPKSRPFTCGGSIGAVAPGEI
jgi:hypothetical protein